jgi:hypothetical protein
MTPSGLAGWVRGRGREVLLLHGGPGMTDYMASLLPELGGYQVASFQQPSTRDVFNCDGRLAAPNNDVGAISRSLCAGLNRSTFGFNHTQPTYNASEFYTRATTNHFSRIVHQNMVDGKAYGFAFDDVGAFESLVHEPNPRSAKVTLTGF